MTVTETPWIDVQGKSAQVSGPRGSRHPVRDFNSALWRGDPEAPSVAGCGRAIGEAQRILVEAGPRGWSTSQLATCKSAWCCDHCAARHQADGVERATFHVEQHLARGGQLVHLTLTVRHAMGDRLGSLLDDLEGARKRLMSSVKWKNLGLDGWCRHLQVTLSLRHGWHPHYHFLLFLPPPATVSAGEIEAVVKARWGGALAREGRTVGARGVHAERVETVNEALYPWHYAPDTDDDPELYHPDRWGDGWDWNPDTDLPDYHPASQRHVGLPVWGLAALGASGDRRACALWREYHAATKGRTMVNYSPGLNSSWKGWQEDGSASELPDDQTVVRDVALVESRVWNLARFHARGSIAERGLQVGERCGLDAMAAFWSRWLGERVIVTEESGLPLVCFAPDPKPAPRPPPFRPRFSTDRSKQRTLQ